MKKVLIISNGHPYQGGRATTAYNLQIFLSSINFDTKVLFINDFNSNGDVDPENSGNSFNISYGKPSAYTLVKSLIRKMISFKISKNIKLTYLIKLVYSKIKNILPNIKNKKSDTFPPANALTSIEAFVTESNFYPDLVITNSPIFYEISDKILGKTKTLLIVSSAFPIIKNNLEADSRIILENPDLYKKQFSKNLINSLNMTKSQVIFNSQLSYKLYSAYGIRPIKKSVQYFNFAPYTISQNKTFFDRKYDIGFIVSDSRRIVKNSEKMINLFVAFPEREKIAIGNGTYLMSKIPNIMTLDLMTQKEVASFLSEIKLIVITSYYDCSPSILSEALLNGCNVLSSKNVGWNEMLEKSCVVQNYNDNNEWIEKIDFLLNNKIENKNFLKIIYNSKNELINLFNDISVEH